MKAQNRKWILHYGRRIIIQIQKLMGRYSLVGDHQFFGPEKFPWCREVEANWRTIREELDVGMQHRDELPDFQQISPDQKHISTENKWKTFSWPVALLNKLIIKIIAASPFIRDAKKNHDHWERRMAKIWN